MFVSCNIAENYWVGRLGFLLFLLFYFRIVMHHNAAKSKNRHYTLNFNIFNLPWRICLDMFWSCQFGLKLIHMNQKYVFLFASLLGSIKSFGSGGFKQGRSGYRKQTYFFLALWEGNANQDIYILIRLLVHVAFKSLRNALRFTRFTRDQCPFISQCKQKSVIQSLNINWRTCTKQQSCNLFETVQA